MTRLLASTDDTTTAGELVAERRAMRVELASLREAAARATGKVVDLPAKTRQRGA